MLNHLFENWRFPSLIFWIDGGCLGLKGSADMRRTTKVRRGWCDARSLKGLRRIPDVFGFDHGKEAVQSHRAFVPLVVGH